jgi:hypothetical protein
MSAVSGFQRYIVFRKQKTKNLAWSFFFVISLARSREVRCKTQGRIAFTYPQRVCVVKDTEKKKENQGYDGCDKMQTLLKARILQCRFFKKEQFPFMHSQLSTSI